MGSLFYDKDGAFCILQNAAGNGTHEKALESAAAAAARDDQVGTDFSCQLEEHGYRFPHFKKNLMGDVFRNEFFDFRHVDLVGIIIRRDGAV